MPELENKSVSVEGLTKLFGSFTAVDNVTFYVRTGEIFGFLGPNGAGKTTIIKILTGLLHPTRGTGSVSGFTLGKEIKAIKRNIGYMSQLFSLYGDLTVEENIAFFSGLNGVAKENRSTRRDWVLEMAGLTEHRSRMTRDLPLGWKQRLALGCAVLHEPKILFLDEPTSGVDPISRRRFWDLIDLLAEAGTTTLVSTHYLEEAEYCHRLALMNRGKLIALGSPDQLRADMSEQIFELRTGDDLGAVKLLQGSPGIKEVALFGRALHVTVEDPSRAIDSIPLQLSAGGITVNQMEKITPSLEDVFVCLVQKEGGARLG